MEKRQIGAWLGLLKSSLHSDKRRTHLRWMNTSRPIDPPPVLKFEVSHSRNQSQASVDLTLLRSPYLMCFATLCEANPPFNELYAIPQSNKSYMVGSMVSSVFQLRESKAPTDDKPGLPEGHYFVFHDFGVRVEGSYRLKFSVLVKTSFLPCYSVMKIPNRKLMMKRSLIL